MNQQPNDVPENIPHTQEMVVDYEVHNMITGEMASAALVSLMRGEDPSIAVAVWTTGTDGHPVERVANMAGVRSELASLRLKRVEAEVDDSGRTALDRFQNQLSVLIAERLNRNTEKATVRRLAHSAELASSLDDPDPQEREYAKTMLENIAKGGYHAPKSVSFLTDYHGVEPDYNGNDIEDNDLLEHAFVRAATNANGGLNEEISDTLNDLLPKKLGFSASTDGTVRVFIDGKQLEFSANINQTSL